MAAPRVDKVATKYFERIGLLKEVAGKFKHYVLIEAGRRLLTVTHIGTGLKGLCQVEAQNSVQGFGVCGTGAVAKARSIETAAARCNNHRGTQAVFNSPVGLFCLPSSAPDNVVGVDTGAIFQGYLVAGCSFECTVVDAYISAINYSADAITRCYRSGPSPVPAVPTIQ